MMKMKRKKKTVEKIKIKNKIEKNEPRGCSVLNELLAMDKILQQKTEVKLIKPNLRIRVCYKCRNDWGTKTIETKKKKGKKEEWDLEWKMENKYCFTRWERSVKKMQKLCKRLEKNETQRENFLYPSLHSSIFAQRHRFWSYTILF